MKEKIITLLKAGKSYSEIVSEVGCTKATISYHANKLGMRKFNKVTYDWDKVQAYINEGHTMSQCIARFGFAKASWDKARLRGAIVPMEWKIPMSDLLVVDSKSNRTHVKKRLIKENLLTYECYKCGLKEWNGKAISLQLEHINGINNDNRIENLCLLCPNCHSQTDTFAGRNKAYKIIAE
jgi:Zn finger protein HypA/HybF involved in hydrogenase expression